MAVRASSLESLPLIYALILLYTSSDDGYCQARIGSLASSWTRRQGGLGKEGSQG